MANVRKTGDLKRQRPEMEQLSVLTLEVARIKESLKRSFAELRRNNIVFRSIGTFYDTLCSMVMLRSLIVNIFRLFLILTRCEEKETKRLRNTEFFKRL